jgi:N utilization substance protein B
MPGKKRREEARECLMLLLYEMEMQNDFSKAIEDRFFEQYADPVLRKEYLERPGATGERSDPEYFNQLLSLIREHLEEIDQTLTRSSDNWRIDRIARIDLAILRLSTAEILYLEEVPVAASINEAVHLAKRFGGADSGKFVNGVLGKIAREGQVTLDS